MIITEAIRKGFPNDLIIAEEDEGLLDEASRARILQLVGRPIVGSFCATGVPRGTGEARFWTIDPIDGTKGYIRGAQYSVCVALVIGGQVVMGIISCPRLGTRAIGSSDQRGCLLLALRGRGAFQLDLHPAGSLQKLPLEGERDHLGAAVLAEGYEPSHANHEFSSALRVQLGISDDHTIRMDSQCKYGLVARGQANIYLRRPRRQDYQEKIWVRHPTIVPHVRC